MLQYSIQIRILQGIKEEKLSINEEYITKEVMEEYIKW